MKTFNRPMNFNGAELKKELADVGIVVDFIRDNGIDTISFTTTNESKAAEIVAAHNGNTVANEPTIEEKLASVGLSLPDLKTALGL
jgi:ABC-type Zn uptake system ZnuABC Zn-binding protein ZnuA